MKYRRIKGLAIPVKQTVEVDSIFKQRAIIVSDRLCGRQCNQLHGRRKRIIRRETPLLGPHQV